MDTLTPSPRRRRPAVTVAGTVTVTIILGAAAWVGAAVPASSAYTTLRYGDHDRQVVTVYPAAAPRPPLAVYIHGGAWRMGSPARVRAKPQWFGEAGWAFASVGYRVLPDAQVEEQAQDVAAGLRALRADAGRLGFDPDRILIMGHSAGAHIAMMTALDPRYLKAQGLGTEVIKGVIGLAGPYDFLPLTTDSSKIAFGQWPDLTETQPITFARADAPPLLLLTGDKDSVVKPRNSKVLSERIAALGGKQQLKIYPDVGHSDIIMAVARPFRNKASVIHDVTTFIKAHEPR